VQPPTPAFFNASFNSKTFSLLTMASTRFMFCYKKM
jgi:hypothetical protein